VEISFATVGTPHRAQDDRARTVHLDLRADTGRPSSSQGPGRSARNHFHGGFTYGQLSFFTLVPQRKFGFALATNSMNGALFARDVVRDLLSKFLGNEEPEPPEIPLDRSQMLEYCGRYSAASGDLELSLGRAESRYSRDQGRFSNTRDAPPGLPRRHFVSALSDPIRIAMVDPLMKRGPGRISSWRSRHDRVAALGRSHSRTPRLARQPAKALNLTAT